MLEIIGPINELYIDIDGLKDICLLIAKIVDTYSSFTASHSIMVGEISCLLATYMHLPEEECKKSRLPAICTILVKLISRWISRKSKANSRLMNCVRCESIAI